MSSGTRPLHLRRRCSFKGYTLIEVLIAMAIFSSMVVLASMALNQGLRQYHDLMEKGLDFWRYARYFWIERSFNSATDYYVHTRGDGWTPYFIGRQDVVSYVTLAPLSGDIPVVAWIKDERGENGKRNLIYYESPVYTKTYEEIEREYMFGDYRKEKSIKLFEDIEDIKISFYGYDLTKRQYGWRNEHDARKMKLLPLVVKLSFLSGGHKDMFIFGLNVNSTIKMNYNDVYPGL